MYTAIYEAHRGFAMLGVALTVVWAALALLPALWAAIHREDS